MGVPVRGMATEATTKGRQAMSNDTLIQEAERLSNAATPGRWHPGWSTQTRMEIGAERDTVETEDRPVCTTLNGNYAADAEFIAAARWMVPELAAALRRAETERDAQAKEFARFKAVAALGNSVARWDSLLNEMHEQKARAQRAEQERDAQAALVATLTAERDEARAGQDQLAAWLRDAMRKAAQYDETQAQVWGLICVATNCAIKADESYPALRQVLDQRAELTATRDLLTAENARLQKEHDAYVQRLSADALQVASKYQRDLDEARAQIATLELLRRGGK